MQVTMQEQTRDWMQRQTATESTSAESAPHEYARLVYLVSHELVTPAAGNRVLVFGQERDSKFFPMGLVICILL